MNKASEEGGWRRIIVEKPFGSSLETAQALNKQLCSIFDEEDIYRIDHFLGKETVPEYTRASVCQPDFRVVVESELHRFYRKFMRLKN